MTHLYRILLDPKGEEGGTPAAAPPAPAQQTPPASQGDPAEGWKALLAKMNNDATAVAQKLYDDNRTLRIKLRDARGNAKPDDGLVLQGDDVQAWNEYRALGKAADLKEALQQRDSFKEEADGLRRAKVYKQAADAHGYKESVLADLIDKAKLPIEVKDEKVNGKPARVAYVKHADDKGKEVETKLPDYAEKHWSDYLPSLAHTAAPPPGTPRRGTTSGPAPTPAGKVPELYEGRNPFY